VDRTHGSVYGPRCGPGGAAHQSAAKSCIPMGIQGASLGEMKERSWGSPRGDWLAARWPGEGGQQ
jgi:hypothetical protein